MFEVVAVSHGSDSNDMDNALRSVPELLRVDTSKIKVIHYRPPSLIRNTPP